MSENSDFDGKVIYCETCASDNSMPKEVEIVFPQSVIELFKYVVEEDNSTEANGNKLGSSDSLSLKLPCLECINMLYSILKHVENWNDSIQAIVKLSFNLLVCGEDIQTHYL